MNRFPPFCLVCVWGACFLLRASALPMNPPPFAGKTLPTPPRQHSPWSPPEGLPGPLVSATISLFQEGMADPRGGDYRQISVTVGNSWNGGGDAFQTHGWVLPRSAKSPETGPRFAVCWNGLVYPVASVGDRADLTADVQAMVKTDSEARAVYTKAQAKSGSLSPYLRFFGTAIPESVSISETSFLPLKVCLLMRLGDVELARQFWTAYLGPDNAPSRTRIDKNGPYMRLADAWVWAQFDRAVTAHMRGDDELSLLTARTLTTVQPLAEAEAKRRGYDVMLSQGVHTAGTPYFPYLEFLPLLLADEERRVAFAKPTPSLTEILKIPAKPARIAALIEALDQVSARQISQPGSVSPDADPIVVALVAQGEDAVEPLIHTLSIDKRLTRSVGFGRDFFEGRSIVSVAGAAYDALVDILHTSDFGSGGTTFVELAPIIQAYWHKNKGVSVQQRWYRTLADDNASPKQWLDAVHEIIRPSDEKLRSGWIERGPDFGKAPPQGEALRQGYTPSVSDLMARRVKVLNTFFKSPDTDSTQFNDVEDGTTMALYFASWDPQAAKPVLREQFQTECRSLEHWRTTISIDGYVQSATHLTLARMAGGDPAALGDYVDWLTGTPLKFLPYYSLVDVFEPLWRAPDDPAAQRGSRALFLGPPSLFVPLVQGKQGFGSDATARLLTSPLIEIAAFRQAALASLADKTVLETVTLGGLPPQNWMYHEEMDPLLPAAPRSFPVRRCDLYAKQLSGLSGMPAFQYDWPTARKDAVVAETTARLKRYGANFAIDPTPIFPAILPGEGGSSGPAAPLLRFPRLGHPATAADVAANRAIFSLGAGAKIWPLPKFPLSARWMTDHRYPRHERIWSVADQKLHDGIGYAQDGLVWQAEEAADGHRFYGFVGPHDIARVPAEEIEFPSIFPSYYDWPQVTEFLEAEAQIGDRTLNSYLLIVSTTDPVPVMLRLRSRRGRTLTVPADFLKTHVTPVLQFSPDDPAAPPLEPTDPKRIWNPVPPRRAAPVPPALARTLTPTEDYAAWTFNLRDDYDLSRPGTYRFQFVFAGQSTEYDTSAPEIILRVPR